jgi:hypothetical protein
MATLVAGVGPGLFALIFVTVLAILIGLVGAFIKPDKAVPIFLGTLILPILTFGLIMAAPTQEQTADVVIDHHYIHRVIFLILMSLGALMGPGYILGVLVIGAPEREAPDIDCRRKRLQKAHPTWVK